MRILPVAVALSAALHGGAIVWVALRPAHKAEPPKAVTPLVEILPPKSPEPAPMIVALLDDHTVVPEIRDLAPAAPASTRERRHESAPTSRIASSATETPSTTRTPSTPAGSSEGTPTRNPLMTMRHGKLENGPSADFWAKFEANTKPLPPKAIAGEQRDSEIAMAESNLGNPRWIANATPDEVTDERVRLVNNRYEHNNAELQPDGEGKKSEHQTFRMKVAPDGTVKIKDKSNIQLHGAGVSFDVTDGFMRSKGIDPYASYKLKVLDETREERYEIGKQYRTQQLAQSRQLMQQNLERLVASAPNAAALKQGLFELWDDCAEAGSAELVAGGYAARSQLVGFIRTRLPAGSADAFTPDELARLNKQRRSQATFAPYGE